MLHVMWKRKTSTSIERLQQTNAFQRSYIPLLITITLGGSILFIASGALDRVKRIFESPDGLDLLNVIFVAVWTDVAFILGLIGTAIICFAVFMKFRPRSNGEIIIELAERVESLEKQLKDKS